MGCDRGCPALIGQSQAGPGGAATAGRQLGLDSLGLHRPLPGTARLSTAGGGGHRSLPEARSLSAAIQVTKPAHRH